MRKSELPALTGIRWFAAVWVVCLHYAPLSCAPALIRSIQGYGYLAVDFFFILSGFILAYNYEDLEAAGAARFYVARFSRIYPDYLFAWLLAAPFALTATLKVIVSGVANLSLLQSWIPQAAFSWNAPAWSVSCEAFFYATLPLVLVALRPRSNVVLWGAAVGALSLSVAVQAAGMVFAPAGPSTNLGAFFTAFPPFRWPQFLSGVALGLLFLRGVRIPLAIGGIGFLGILALTATLSTAVIQPASTVALALLVPGLAGSAGRVVQFLSLRPIRMLGQASYATYLLQEPIAQYVRWGGTWFFAYFAVLQVASIGTFLLVEEPGRKWIMRRWKSRGELPLTPSAKHFQAHS